MHTIASYRGHSGMISLQAGGGRAHYEEKQRATTGGRGLVRRNRRTSRSPAVAGVSQIRRRRHGLHVLRPLGETLPLNAADTECGSQAAVL